MLSKYLPKNPYGRAAIVFVLYFGIISGVTRLLGAAGEHPLIETGVISAFLTALDHWWFAKASRKGETIGR
jgi:hypothetical protein